MSTCTEDAIIQLPWGGKIYHCCPIHANSIAQLAQVTGNNIKAEVNMTGGKCDMNDDLTEQQKKYNGMFMFKYFR